MTEQKHSKLYPLTSPQREIWFDQMLHPSVPLYNIGGYRQVDGAVDPKLFELAMNLLVQRHDALRTVLVPSTSDLPRQTFLKVLKVTVPVHDFSAENNPRQSALAWMQQQFVQPFELYETPLFHFALLKIDENCFFGLEKYHHLIVDGWSISLITQSLAEIYTQLRGQFCERVAPSYLAFVNNDRAYLESERYEVHRQYWIKKYQTLPEPLFAPRYLSQFADQIPPSECRVLWLPRPFYNRLLAFAKQTQSTLFHVMLGALYVYFTRTTQREELAIGLPVLNRSHATFKETVGLFIGASVAWFQFGTQFNFRQLLKAIGKSLKSDYRHQRLPVSELNRAVGLQKKGRRQLFDIQLNYAKHDHDTEFGRFKAKSMTLTNNHEQTPLSISVWEFHETENVQVDFVYNLAYFDAAEIERIQSRFLLILEYVLNHAEESIRTIPLLTEAEQQQLLAWNQTQTDYPFDKTLVDLFQAQVEKTPEKIAVVFENQQLSYLELNKKANQLAHYLLNLKTDTDNSSLITDNCLVGICVERSLKMVIGLLGILKAGGAYVPLDPAYPPQRLQFMLEDSTVPVLLTQTHLLEMLSVSTAFVVCLETEWEKLAGYSGENPVRPQSPTNLAYVIYTSGSTGKPKGVLGTHKGMVNRLNWMWQTCPFEAEEVCCHRTSINFVDHVAELFSPLLKGVSLVLLTEDEMRDTVGIINTLHQYKIVRLLLVPSLLRSFLEQEEQELQKLTSVKYWFCSGEALPVRLVKLFYERVPKGTLFNIYGSSEVSADVSAYQVERQEMLNILNYFSPDNASNYSLSEHLPPESITTPFVTLDELKQTFENKEVPLLPQEKDEYYAYLKEYVLPYLVNTSSPRFIGHMTSVLPSFNYEITDLVSRLNQNMVKVETSKSLVFLERQAMAMLHHAFYDFPESFYTEYAQQSGNSLGITVSGGSMANISALWIARNLVLPPDDSFPGVAEAGLNAALAHYNYNNIVLLGSRLMHYSMKKAVSLLGLGMENIVYVDQDENGKMDIAALQRSIEECRQKKWCILALVGIAGATETGNIDPLEEMAEIAKTFKIHFHVDGAWGGPVIFSNRHKRQLKGIEKADSITLCGHKQLYLPMGISFCLFRQPDMVNAISISTAYQAREGGYDFGQYSPEGSRSSLSMCLHAALHLIGKQGYAKLIDNGIDKAHYLTEQLHKTEAFELMREPELNIVNFRYIPTRFRDKQAQGLLTPEDNLQINEANVQLQEMQFQEGRSFFSRTQLSNTRYGKDLPIEVNRAVLANPLTTYQDIDFVLEDQLTIAAKLIENEYPSAKQEVSQLASSQPKRAEQEALLDKYTLPIGKPISNTQIYILDPYQKPVPVGVSGELHVGGIALARGYLNHPELTAEKFIDIDVFGKPQRVYKTGDMACWLPDGNLEYLGRLDHQVKLRGFRIELGEIEVTLSQHDAVKEAVVVLYNIDSNPRLVAYITLAMPIDDVAGVLRTWLKTRLPEYMLPASVTVLDKLPLTPNGKIDRKALPAPDLALQETVGPAPRSETERLLCNLWSQVLNIEVTSRLSHFFETGGHSLSATQLVSRIRERFGVEMPLRMIFERPVLQEQAEWLDNEQRGSELPPIVPRAEGEPLVWSFAQQRLWFLAQLEGKSAAYNMPAALRLTGQLNETALQRALTALIQRHESLRLCLPMVDGDATVQLNEVYNPLSVTDLSHLSETEQQRQVTEWTTNHAQTPFELSTGPLLSLRLLKLGQQKQILLFNMHHIISDGWSIGVLIRELRQLYRAYAQNKVPPLPKLPVQYTDYAAWQRNWLQGKILEQQLAYWLDKLSGAPELLELPTDYPRPAVMSYQGKHQQSTLDQKLTLGIKQLSQQHGVTVFMALLATFKVLLYRYSGQTDQIVGSPVANRTHHQTEDVIGLFVNTLVLRTQIEGTQTFSELLKQVRQTALEAYSHQDIPFEYLVEQLNPSRSLSHSPLFQVMFVLQNAPEEALEFSGLKMAFLEPEQTTAQFDLSLSVAEQDDVFVCDWEYCTELFRPETITLLSEHFQVLLEGIINNPEQLVSQLPLLTEAEKQQLLAWNQTQTDDYPVSQTIVDLFQTQVEKTPENVAVVFEEQALSYRALNRSANQLAHYLISLGVEAETLVAICVERSLDMVIGLFGILKAGGAYLPLESTYPAARLAFMLEDAEVSLLLTQSSLVDKLSSHNSPVVCLDTERDQWSQKSADNPDKSVQPTNLAYVIYTSGSTGKPKGVMIEHQSLVNFVKTAIVGYGLTERDSILQFAPISFDVAADEIYCSLTCGGRLILRSEEMLNSVPVFLQHCQNLGLTVLELPTAFWHKMTFELARGQIRLPDSLRLVIIGGERALSEPVGLWLKWVGTFPLLINGYGPTEATVAATWYKLSPSTPLERGGREIPIGRAISNVQTYVLDKYLQLVPIGVPGELHIGGACLARGYKGRPDLTAQKFIQNPLTDDPNARLYKTGDLVRYLPDGNLEYLGRIDNQVKIRGFRIELGEIEAMLGQHPSVAENAVIVHEVSQTDKRLVAYLVPNKTQMIENTEEIRNFLTERLPDYMVPSAFVTLETLPLTPNDKIDRQALSQLSVNRDQLSDEAFVAPRTSEEKLLAGIWADVLGLENVSIFDDFFELGGHSLLATLLVSRICESFAIELPLHELFQSPTIAGIAQAIEQARQADNQSVTTSIDLSTETVLEPLIQTSQSSPPVQVDKLVNPQAIFLTGATGFLGTYLLYELLEQTTADIYCLSRDADTAQKRLQSQLESYSLWQETYRHRLLPVIGDLSKPRLGLSEPQFSELSDKLDIIYHNGAWVNHIYPYTVLKATNVLGTQEVLRLAFQTKTKPVHFVSTFFSIPTVEESDSVEQSQLVDGYVQSKWVAEQLVKQARERGLPVCIYRPSRITGHSQTGISNLVDILNLLIKGCLQLGKAPVFGEIEEYLTPVDYVSRAIVYLSQQPKHLGKSFDLIHSHSPTRWHDLLFNKLRALGYPLEQTSYASWRTELSHQTTNALYPLLSLFPLKEDSVEQAATDEPAFDYRKTISFQNTLEGLADTDIVCPRFDNELLSTYFSYFWNSGFLEAPYVWFSGKRLLSLET
jgi:putative pyridoxal-dependent aspartate 1-decarboxylase